MDAGVLPIILCGGSGTRLWPLSTPERPKPFHRLAGEDTLLQATVRRLAPAPGTPFLAPVVICAEAHRSKVRAQLRRMGVRPALLISEKAPGGTALAAAVAAMAARLLAPEAKVLIAPADHRIDDAEGFRAALACAAANAHDRIVLFSARPDRAEPGYGHLRAGKALAGGLCRVERFVEKPPLHEARALTADRGWGWNMGLFLAAPDVLAAAIARHAPQIASLAEGLWATARRRGAEIALGVPAGGPLPSLDRAVIEKSERLAVMACDVGWRDVGGWDALWSAGGRDGRDNHLKGAATAVDSSGCLVWSGGPPVAVIGMTDVVVVSTPSGVLVMPRARAHEAGALSGVLAGAGRTGSSAPFYSPADELGFGHDMPPHQDPDHDLRRPLLDI